MKHTSIKLNTPCEFINIVPVNPLISKCQIKVCYVGEEPNRNKSVITKETATKLAQSLPGSPIVGMYNESTEDFEEHNKTISISNGKFIMKDDTRPYGFVDLGAKVWFQKFLDDGVDEREYLMTEGYLWTGQYPEAQRIIDSGNNQSMELDKDFLDASWTKDNNGKPQFFIINEAIISKLCILGEEYEPCFEGASIAKVEFSFEDSFKEQLYSMMKQVSELLNKEKGGEKEMFNTFAVEIGDTLWSALYRYVVAHFPCEEDSYCAKYCIDGVFEEADGAKFAVLKDPKTAKYYRLDFSMTEENGFVPAEEVVEVTVSYTPAAEPQFALEEYEAYEAEFKKQQDDKKKEEDKTESSDTSESDNSSEDEKASKEDSEDKEDSKEEDSSEKDSDEEDEKKKKKQYSLEEEKDEIVEDSKNEYNLEDISEYVELSKNYIKLESEFKALTEEKASLEEELNSLKEFKLVTERKEKEVMINETFYMLSDEDKADVKENIDKYSLDEIEAKLSVICVRNKVFNLDPDKEEEKEENPVTFSLGEEFINNATPAWVAAALEVAKKMN